MLESKTVWEDMMDKYLGSEKYNNAVLKTINNAKLFTLIEQGFDFSSNELAKAVHLLFKEIYPVIVISTFDKMGIYFNLMKIDDFSTILSEYLNDEVFKIYYKFHSATVKEINNQNGKKMLDEFYDRLLMECIYDFTRDSEDFKSCINTLLKIKEPILDEDFSKLVNDIIDSKYLTLPIVY